jgi:DHA1 family bicyclomycin/chloramphenicol resistance-like MFS transporter
MTDQRTTLSTVLICGVLLVGTVLGLAGTDLVLPSIPDLPAQLPGTAVEAQYVLAAYVGGAALGLFLFGSLADHMRPAQLLALSLGLFALLSLACVLAPSIWALVGLRFLQGAVSSGAAVLAPGVIRRLFDEHAAARVIGVVGSIESLVPALAPVAGAWLGLQFGWTASFVVTGVLAAIGTLVVGLRPSILPAVEQEGRGSSGGSYLSLFGNAQYLRYAVSHALVLGALLTFVFAAPVLIVHSMAGSIGDFIVLQIAGVTTFIACANGIGLVIGRLGTERLIMIGTVSALLGAVGLSGYALAGGNQPLLLIPFWLLINGGLGVRGGAGFVKALAAAPDNDARASAMMILLMTIVAAGSTALLAPFLDGGLIVVAGALVALLVPAVLLLVLIKPMAAAPQPA